MTIESSLCAIIDQERILLLRKATGIGKGKWYPTGGKVRPRETHEDGVVREVYEETGLRVTNLRHHGVVTCFFGKGAPPVWSVQIFSSNDFTGDLKESREGVLRWFPINDIPYNDMWEDDRYWLPLLLKGKRFNGKFIYDENGAQIVDASIEIM